MRLPASSSLPSPAARILPFCGFSLAVSGSTRPLAVVSSSSIARTIRRSPRGFSFMLKTSVSRDAPGGSTFDPPFGTLTARVPAEAQYIRNLGRFKAWLALARLNCQQNSAPLPGEGGQTARKVDRNDRKSGAGGPNKGPTLVLRAAEPFHRLGHPARLVEDLRKAHHGDRVFGRHRASVDLFEKVDQLLVATKLGVVVLDVPRREI